MKQTDYDQPMPLTTPFAGDKKSGSSLCTSIEKPMQRWLAGKMPSWMQTYHLTMMTLLWSALLIYAGYMAQAQIAWLWMSCFAIILQYFTDLVDGEVGRQRKTGLIKWGYYMDHFLDYIFLCAYVAGFAFITPQDSLLYLLFFLIVSGAFMANAFLSFSVTNRFQIGYFGVGPTEIRLIFIAINVAYIAFGAESVSAFLPHAVFICTLALCLTVWRTQRAIWAMDMEAKNRAA